MKLTHTRDTRCQLSSPWEERFLETQCCQYSPLRNPLELYAPLWKPLWNPLEQYEPLWNPLDKDLQGHQGQLGLREALVPFRPQYLKKTKIRCDI